MKRIGNTSERTGGNTHFFFYTTRNLEAATHLQKLELKVYACG